MTKSVRYFLVMVLVFGLFAVLKPVPAAAIDEGARQRFDAAGTVLREIMAAPDKAIPEDLLRSAQGIAVFPGTAKVAVGIGGEYGQGVMVSRSPDGKWSAPSLISLRGGSLGVQLGGQSSDLILVFKTARSIEAVRSGDLTLGLNFAVAAGPVGRDTQASTDAQLKAEILSYSRTKGLFLGVALDGSALRIDYAANKDFFGVADPGRQGLATVPDPARQFSCIVSQYTGAASNVCA